MWRDRDAARADMVEELLPGFGGAALYVFVGDPASVEGPAKLRTPGDQLHGLIYRLRVKLRNLGGIVGKADVQMLVRDDGHSPFFCRSDGHGRK